MVVGDVPALEFHRWSPDSLEDEAEVWSRITTTTIGGRLISIFEPSWNANVLGTMLRGRAGYDRPWLYWGWIAAAGTRRSVYLRLGFNGIPRSEVVVVDSGAQYASNVINIVMPGFGDGRVTAGPHGFELAAATRQTLRYVADNYDAMVFIPTANAVADYGAFHQNVRNTVRGINITPFDQSSAYGGSRSLQSVELYTAAFGAQYEDSNHEMAHQWGINFDWSRIAGISRAGHQPGTHSPLWTGGESLVGAVLWPNRRVRTTASGFAVEATPAPVHYHPLELYAMGVLPADKVPDFGVFEDQAQFDAGSASNPNVDIAVNGALRARVDSGRHPRARRSRRTIPDAVAARDRAGLDRPPGLAARDGLLEFLRTAARRSLECGHADL